MPRLAIRIDPSTNPRIWEVCSAAAFWCQYASVMTTTTSSPLKAMPARKPPSSASAPRNGQKRTSPVSTATPIAHQDTVPNWRATARSCSRVKPVRRNTGTRAPMVISPPSHTAADTRWSQATKVMFPARR